MFYTHDYDDCYSSINNQTISRQRTSRSCRIEQSSSCCTEHFIDSGERANSLCTADAANNRILIATDSQSSVAALSKLEPYPRPHRSKHDAGSFLMLSRGRVTASPPSNVSTTHTVACHATREWTKKLMRYESRRRPTHPEAGWSTLYGYSYS